MRVLILGLGGVSRHFRNWPERTLGQALVRAGHDVHAITYWQPDTPHLGLEQRTETIDGINVRRVRPQFFPARDLVAALSAMPLPDVAHIMHPRNVLAWRAVRWLKARGVPIVWTWLGPYHDRWLIADRERPYEHQPHPEWLIYTLRDALRQTVRDRRLRENLRNYGIHGPLRHVDAFIPCSRHEAEVLAAIGFGDRPMTVVPLWLDMNFMRDPAPELTLPLTRPIIPYIGQLTVRKCYDMVIEAMPALVARFPQASFVFVTHNPEQRANLQGMVAERGVAANLHFLGTISEEEKLALLRASDVLPFPSRYEGFGLPLLEGMAAGTPVISTNIPVVNEIVRDGENGLLIPYDDVAALERAILAILDDGALRARLVAGGRRTVAEQFDPQALVKQVVEVYQSVQSKSAGSLDMVLTNLTVRDGGLGAAEPPPDPHPGRCGGAYGPSTPPQTVKLIAAKRNLVLGNGAIEMSNQVRLPAGRTLRYEVALNGWKILRDTINDFSLWRLIEYPWCTDALDLRRGDLVLDIGTGTATFPQMLAREGVNTVVLELDAGRVRWQQRKSRETSRPGDGKVYAVVADATALPIKSGVGRRVSAISSLEHIPDDEAVGREIGRVLAQDGVAVITIPYTRTERRDFFKGIRKFRSVERNAFVQEGKSGSFFRFYNDQDIQETYIKPSGGRVVRWGGFGRRILNGMYHETRLTKYWRRFVIKDWLLAKTVHPLEERFGQGTEPLYVMFKIVKE